MTKLGAAIRAAVVALLNGCGAHALGISIGRGAPARPSDCALRYERLLPGEAQHSYEQVGVLRYSYPGAPFDFPPPDVVVDDVRSEACRLGGEIIVLHGFSPTGARSFEIGVYVAKRMGAPARTP